MDDELGLLGAALTTVGLPSSEAALLSAISGVTPSASWSQLRRFRTIHDDWSLTTELQASAAPWVEARTAVGMSLSASFRLGAIEALRSLFSVGRAPELLRAVHHEIELAARELSPLLERETQMVWSYVTEETSYTDTCNRIWREILLSHTIEHREGIGNWAYGAIRRLPRPVLATAGGYLATRIVDPSGPPVPPAERPDLDLVRQLASSLPTRVIGLRRTPAGLDIGDPTRARAHGVRVPALAGFPLHVRWTDQDLVEHVVDVHPSEGSTFLPTGRAEVELRDALGTSYRLEGYVDGTPPEMTTLMRDLDRLAIAAVTGEELEAHVLRLARASLVIAIDVADSVQAVVPNGVMAVRGAGPGDPLTVQVKELDRERRLVVCDAVGAHAIEQMFAVGQLEAAHVVAMIGSGAIVTVRDGAAQGLLHNSELPAALHLDVGSDLTVRVKQILVADQRLSLELDPPRPGTIFPRDGRYRDLAERDAYLAQVAATLRSGQQFPSAEVVALSPLGAVVMVSPGKPGFLPADRFRPGRPPRVGERIAVWITASRGRVYLSLLHPSAEQPPPRAAGVQAEAIYIARMVVSSMPQATRVHTISSNVAAALSLEAREATWFGFSRFHDFLRWACPGIRFTLERPDSAYPWHPGSGVPDSTDMLTSTRATRLRAEVLSAARRAADFLEEFMSQQQQPMPYVSLSNRLVLEVGPEQAEHRWYGYRSFLAFVEAECPRLRPVPGSPELVTWTGEDHNAE